MIVTFTPNPALDRTLIVPGFRHGDVTRVRERHDAAGGKGLNVTRALHTLHAPCLALAPLGGPTGTMVANLAAAEGLALQTIPIGGETRTCLSITDPAAPDQLVINEPGPTISAAEWHTIQTAVQHACTTAEWLTISGSLPPGVSPADLRALINAVPQRCAVAVDTSGAPLSACLDAPIALLKINRDELAQALATTFTTEATVISAARSIIARGPRAVVVTLGAAGALAVSATAAWHISAPTIIAVSPVGSGDCTLAGLVDALARGGTLPTAVAAGVGCGSANALAPRAGVFVQADALRFGNAATIRVIAS
jgi:1-phosphofructokinase family hexose kinase